MKFKVGQIVKGTRGLGKIVVINDEFNIGVEHFRYSGSFHSVGGRCKEGYGWFYCPEMLEICVPINPINKILYPDYTEKYGYLVPRSFDEI